MACGSALTGDAQPAPAPVAPAPAPIGVPPEERRRVTVLFADLSGYTAIAAADGPEAVKTFVDRGSSASGRRWTATAARSTSTSATT